MNRGTRKRQTRRYPQRPSPPVPPYRMPRPPNWQPQWSQQYWQPQQHQYWQPCQPQYNYQPQYEWQHPRPQQYYQQHQSERNWQGYDDFVRNDNEECCGQDRHYKSIPVSPQHQTRFDFPQAPRAQSTSQNDQQQESNQPLNSDQSELVHRMEQLQPFGSPNYEENAQADFNTSGPQSAIQTLQPYSPTESMTFFGAEPPEETSDLLLSPIPKETNKEENNAALENTGFKYYNGPSSYVIPTLVLSAPYYYTMCQCSQENGPAEVNCIQRSAENTRNITHLFNDTIYEQGGQNSLAGTDINEIESDRQLGAAGENHHRGGNIKPVTIDEIQNELSLPIVDTDGDELRYDKSSQSSLDSGHASRVSSKKVHSISTQTDDFQLEGTSDFKHHKQRRTTLNVKNHNESAPHCSVQYSTKISQELLSSYDSFKSASSTEYDSVIENKVPAQELKFTNESIVQKVHSRKQKTRCPLARLHLAAWCEWEGYHTDRIKHMETDHKDKFLRDCRAKLEKNSYKVLFHEDEFFICYNSEHPINKKLHCIVHHACTKPMCTDKFQYTCELTFGEGLEKIENTGIVAPIYETFKNLKRSGKCVKLDSKVLNNLGSEPVHIIFTVNTV